MAGIHTEKESKKMSGFYIYHFSIVNKTLVVEYTPQGGDSQKPRTVAKKVMNRDESIIKAKEHFNKVSRMFEIKGKNIPEVFYP